MVRKLLENSTKQSRRASLVEISYAFEDKRKLREIAGKNIYVDTLLYTIAKNDDSLMSMLRDVINVDDFQEDIKKAGDNLKLRAKRNNLLQRRECNERV